MDKRRKELALLGVGVLVVLVALYLTFRPRAKPAAARPPVAPTQAQAEPAAKPPPPQPEQQPALVESGAATTPGRNPFKPVLLAQAPPAVRPAAAAPPPGAVEPLPIGPWIEPGTQPGVAPSPVDQRLRLTGIVDGERPVAVLRQGAKRYFVTIGDPVDTEYTVKSISDGRVVLADGKGTLSLTLRGRM